MGRGTRRDVDAVVRVQGRDSRHSVPDEAAATIRAGGRVDDPRPGRRTNGTWRPAEPCADRWSRVGSDELTRTSHGRLIAAAVSVVVFATAFVVVLFDAGHGDGPARHGPVEPIGRYVLVAQRQQRTFADAVPNACDRRSARPSLDRTTEPVHVTDGSGRRPTCSRTVRHRSARRAV